VATRCCCFHGCFSKFLGVAEIQGGESENSRHETPPFRHIAGRKKYWDLFQGRFLGDMYITLGTNISRPPKKDQKGTFEDDFPYIILFPRWDMLVPCRVPFLKLTYGK